AAMAGRLGPALLRSRGLRNSIPASGFSGALMQQRQLRLGDILDDYCPRERRLTNHAVVAMIGDDVKQTRCTTCDAEHEYKHAKAPRKRPKSQTPAALYAQVAASGPKRVAHEAASANGTVDGETPTVVAPVAPEEPAVEEPLPVASAPVQDHVETAPDVHDGHDVVEADVDEHDDDHDGERGAEDG